MHWCLASVTDADVKWLVNIESVPFVIGRADDCDLKLTDKRISRHHSEIYTSGPLLWIRDLESTNGTYVNQVRIENAQLLEPNDTIAIGAYKFEVTSISPSATATAHETLCVTLGDDLEALDPSPFESKLRQLLQQRDVFPHFQPLIRFSDLSTVGYEILGRIGCDGLPANPAELLDLAESMGCGSELSSLFREVGVELGQALPGRPLLFVNSTRLEIRNLDALLASMQRIRELAPANKIILEIHEKAAADTSKLPLLRKSLEAMDMGLAFDDFGVGQTRLVELSNTPPDYLKFDMSLIRKIHLAPKRLHQMLSTFIRAAHDLGILTLAEGIECIEESAVCQQLGFDLGQGYLFGKPEPIDAVKKRQVKTKAPGDPDTIVPIDTDRYGEVPEAMAPIDIRDLNQTIQLD